MNVRDLIRALEQHDPEMEVVIPADPELRSDYAVVGAAVPDVLAPAFNGGVELAELQDEGARVVLRLCGVGVTPETVPFKQ